MRNFRALFAAAGSLLFVVLLAFGVVAGALSLDVAFASSIVQQAYNLVQDQGSPLTRRTTMNFVGAGVTCADSGGVTECDIPGGMFTGYDTIEDEGTPLTQRTTLNFIGAGIACADDAGNMRTNCTANGGGSGQHVITFVIDGGGSAIGAGDLDLFPTANFSCTIDRWDVSADASGSIEVDIWKAAGAIPTSSDVISGTDPPSLSTAQLAQNGSVSSWTTSVSAGDVFGGEVVSAMTVGRVTVQVWCQ